MRDIERLHRKGGQKSVVNAKVDNLEDEHVIISIFVINVGKWVNWALLHGTVLF